MSVKVFDADVLVPQSQDIKVGGKVFSIGKIPMRISIKIYENMSKQKGAEDFAIVENMADVVYSVLKLSDPKLTKDWVLDNIDMRSLAPLFSEICELMNRVAEKKPTVEVE